MRPSIVPEKLEPFGGVCATFAVVGVTPVPTVAVFAP